MAINKMFEIVKTTISFILAVIFSWFVYCKIIIKFIIWLSDLIFKRFGGTGGN